MAEPVGEGQAPSGEPGDRPRVGCYPGSFDPLTVAHLAVAEAAVAAASLERLDLVLSYDALGKGHLDEDSVAARRAALEAQAEAIPWLGVAVTRHRLIADIAQGYDAVVMGADKWRQVIDPAWYGDESERDAAIARLPRVLVAPRGDDVPELDGPARLPGGVELLDVHPSHRHVSASAVRAGHPEAEGWRAVPGAPVDGEG